MEITVANNIIILDCESKLLALITKELTMPNPVYVKEKARHNGRTFGIDKEIQLYTQDYRKLYLPRGYLERLKGHLLNTSIAVTWHMETTQGHRDTYTFNPNIKLRDYQLEALGALKDQCVLQAPAGSGKTIMGMAVIQMRGCATLWLTHTKDLMYQTKAAAEFALPNVGRIGILGDERRDFGDGKLIIATVQTLDKNPDMVEQLTQHIGQIIVDEAHHFPAPAFHETVGKFPAHYRLGLTATPHRRDGLDEYLFTGIGPIVHKVERERLYTEGSLVMPQLEFVYTDFEYDQASMVSEFGAVDAGGEDLNYSKLIETLIADKERQKLIAANILKKYPGNSTIVLTESVRYCHTLMELVADLAIMAGDPVPRMTAIHGQIQRYKWQRCSYEQARHAMATGAAIESKKVKNSSRYEIKVPAYTDEELERWNCTNMDRKNRVQWAKDGEYDIIFATQLAREGLDMPHLNVLHLAMPKHGDDAKAANGGALEQELGRIMRADPNNPNKRAYVYDYVDYEMSLFVQQYQSRRRVYKRLGMVVPRKKKTLREQGMDILLNTDFGDFPL